MKKITTLLLCLAPFLLRAQDQGIKFEASLSWKEIEAKAKAENKYIFVDCYASWCGPCKWMTANIYPQKEVGDYFNAHFVNVAVQMDKTAKDADDIKSFYADAEMLSKTYQVGEYPTYLFFTPDGEIVHRFAATTPNGSEFIEKGKEAFDPEKQFYTLLNRCEEHKTDSAYLRMAWITAMKQGNKEMTEIIAGYYIKTLKFLFVKDNINSMSGLLQFLGQDHFPFGYSFFINNAQKIDSIITDNSNFFAESVIANFIFDKQATPLFNDSNAIVLWSKFKKEILSDHPNLTAGLLHWEKQRFDLWQQRYIKVDVYKLDPSNKGVFEKKLKEYYRKFPDTHENVEKYFLEGKYKLLAKNQLWEQADKAAYAYLRSCDKNLSTSEINEVCWEIIFKHCNNKQILHKGIVSMQSALDNAPNDQNLIDTYANLLYKSGQVSNAIVWEKKAIDIANKIVLQPNINQTVKYLALRDRKTFQETLAKMQSGVPTWTDDVIPATNP